jgi:hypothetical protein
MPEMIHPVSTAGIKLRLSGRHYQLLAQHLFPGDGKEAVALALCGQTQSLMDEHDRYILMVHDVIPVPHEICSVRTPERVTWQTEKILLDLIPRAQRYNHLLLKIHSHPGEWPYFSKYDDQADRELFASVAGWLDTDHPGASVIMLPDGRLFGRVIDDLGQFTPISSIAVAGNEIQVWYQGDEEYSVPEYAKRTAQAFGSGTTARLSQLSIAVVGCSGTGSPVVEMLGRLDVGELVLVDPKSVDKKNLNRIYNATIEDVRRQRYKVDVLADAVRRMGLGTRVVPIPKSLFNSDVVRRVAQCDVVFGCMDSVDGRDLLNRLCTFYVIPYFDVGVRLVADGQGGVEQVCGSVHYLQPGGSSLLSRGVYTSEQLYAAGLYRTNPEEYKDQRQKGYIQGVAEERPAVSSVNTYFASSAVNEFLARLHPYRDDPNSNFAAVTVSLSQMRMLLADDGVSCSVLAPYVGRGDVRPLLNLPELSER